MTARRTMGAALAALILSGSFAIGAGARFAYALFGESETVLASFTTAASFSGTVYRLHNNPTPATGDTTSQANLPMDTTAPTAATLFNYDTDRDAFPGLVVARGASGAGETNLALYQNWLTSPLASPLTITSGTVRLEFWSATKDFATTQRGVLTAYLRDFNPLTSTPTYVEIANATLDVADWQGGSGTWVHHSLAITVPLYVMAIGHRLELKVIVPSTSDVDMWFAYDTTNYRTFLQMP